ncbi:MAG: hypothetical protein DMG90_07000 [Acidobacteria bacterium]|jgi:hypothetical protein|nr:MAG: hypothetical protein DMG91_13060 [Acidobacteriota bacterium]PYV91473.1 MAG: hypothetical protein DMG90_07000 [Acidobacteriota bacterium]
MPRKATAADAQLIMQLYDLRREAEMRKARAWFANFWPSSAEDILAVSQKFGSQENAWLRQVGGYWEMATAMVLRGALNEDLFFDANGELWFVFAKIQPYLKEVRERMNAPEAFRNTEKVVTGSKQGRERLQRMAKRAESFRKSLAESAKA